MNTPWAVVGAIVGLLLSMPVSAYLITKADDADLAYRASLRRETPEEKARMKASIYEWNDLFSRKVSQ